MEYTYGKFIIEEKPSKPIHLKYGINFEGFKEELKC